MRGKEYDHLAHPLSVFGMRVVVHEKPMVSGTWATHGKDGFYLGPALAHYRSWRVYVTATGGTRVSDTLAWFPTPYTMPGHSPLEQLTAAVQNLVHAVSTVTEVEQNMLLKDASTGTLALGPTLTESVTRLQELIAPAVATDKNVSGATEPSPLTPTCGPTLPVNTPSEFQRVPIVALSEPITVSDVSPLQSCVSGENERRTTPASSKRHHWR